MKIFNPFLFACIVVLSACATTYTFDKLTPDEQAYMTKVNAAFTTFEVEKEKAEKYGLAEMHLLAAFLE